MTSNPFLPPIFQMPWDAVGITTDGGTAYIGPAGTPPPPGNDSRPHRIPTVREILGIPPGFPIWYRPPQLALPVGPIGRCMMWAEFLQRLAIVEAERWALPDNPLDASAWLDDQAGGTTSDDR